MAETVTLRAKKTKTKGYSLYLDIYFGPKANDRRFEYLGRYVSKDYTKGGRILKEDRLEWDIANTIYEKRKEEIRSKGFEHLLEGKKEISFIKHLESICDEKNNASYFGALQQLKAFLIHKKATDLRIRELDYRNNRKLLHEIRDFILSKVKTSTTAIYWKRYKIAFDELRENRENPFEAISIKVDGRESKSDYLTLEDIEKLDKTRCSSISETDKLAFLFSCFTGLRLSDVIELQWDNIKPDKILKPTKKSGYEKIAKIPISDKLSKIIERLDRNMERPFSNISHRTTVNKNLKKWQQAANIKLERDIHFHMARHSFASNLARRGANIVVLSRLMTHSSLDQTMEYYQDKFEESEEAISLFDL